MTKDGTHVNRSLLVKHCNKAGHNRRRCPEDPVCRERMLNPKKRLRAKKYVTPTPVAPPPIAIPESAPLNENNVTEEFWNEATHVSTIYDKIQLLANEIQNYY